MARARRFGSWSLVGILGAATVVGSLGAWSWAFDLVANARFHLVVVSLVASIVVGVLAVRRRDAELGAMAGVLAVCVVVNGIVVAPLWRGGAARDSADEALRIGHVNLQGYAIDGESLGGELAEGRIDVLIVLDTSSDASAVATHVRAPYEVVPGPAGSDSLIVARTPVRTVATPPDERLPPSTTDLEVDIDGRAVRVLALHTRSPVTPGRSASRDDALEAVGDWQRAQRGPVLVVGDLNATRWSAAMRRLADTTTLSSSEDGAGFQPSFPASFGLLGLPIDHSLHSPELAPVARWLGPTFGSGHRSLVVSYTLAS